MLLHCTITKGTVIDKVILLVLDFFSFATPSNVSCFNFRQSFMGVTALFWTSKSSHDFVFLFVTEGAMMKSTEQCQLQGD